MKKIFTLLLILTARFGFTQTLPTHDNNKSNYGDVSIVKFNGDGKFLAVGYDQGRIEIWDLQTKPYKMIASQDKPKAVICTIDFVDEFNQLMVVYKYAGIGFLDLHTLKITKFFTVDFNEYVKHKPELLLTANYNPSRKILGLSGNIAARIVLIDVETLYKSKPASDTVRLLRTRDVKRVFPEPEKGSFVYEIVDRHPLDKSVIQDLESNIESFANQNEIITTIKILPSMKQAFAGTKSGKIIKWDLLQKDKTLFPAKILPTSNPKYKTEFRDILGLDGADSTLISVGFGSGDIGNFQIWDTSDLSLINFIEEADPSTCRKIILTSDGKYGITTGDFSYRLWQKKNDEYKLLEDIEYAKSVGYDSKTSCVDILNDRLLAVGDQKNVFFYNLEDLKFLNNLRDNTDHLKELKH